MISRYRNCLKKKDKFYIYPSLYVPFYYKKRKLNLY